MCIRDRSECDAYVNVTGGLRLNEPALDLAIVTAVVSSMREQPVNEGTMIFGEVGLSGEVRSVSMVQQRVNEAAKLGFTRCILPASGMEGLQIPAGIRCEGVKNIREAAALIG